MVQIQHDRFPYETSYELKEMLSEEGQDEVLASHSGSSGDEYKNHDESICLGDGLYSFLFYDSYGDGFYGEYSLTLLTGEQSSNETGTLHTLDMVNRSCFAFHLTEERLSRNA